MNNFMVPSVSVQQGLTVNIMRAMTPYLNWEKLGGGMGITRKERGLSLCFPSPDYRRLVNMYEFHILKSFYNTKKYVVITCVCTY